MTEAVAHFLQGASAFTRTQKSHYRERRRSNPHRFADKAGHDPYDGQLVAIEHGVVAIVASRRSTKRMPKLSLGARWLLPAGQVREARRALPCLAVIEKHAKDRARLFDRAIELSAGRRESRLLGHGNAGTEGELR